MYIEQSKLTDNVVKNIPNENNGMGIENFLIKNEEQSGFFANKTEEYSKENAVVNACGNVNMANATYQKPFSKEDKNEIDDNLTHGMVMTAENRMNQMVVASNTMTAEDYQKMQEDGFSFDNASSHTVITETDKIKAVLAKAGVDVSIYGDELSQEQLQEITGSAAVATQIEQKMQQNMQQNDIPATSENMDDAKNAYNQAIEIGSLSDEAIAYILKNELTPTISNLYKAQFSSQTSGNTYQTKSGMSDKELEEMSAQINNMIKSFGMSVDEKNISNAFWLIKNDIELTADNLSYLNQLQGLTLDSEKSSEIISGMVDAIAEGNRPADAMMLDGFSIKDRAENAVNIIDSATAADVDYVINSGLTLNIHNLSIAVNIRQNGGKTIAEPTESAISARRTLEEIRLIMTSQANYSLLKRGISIDTRPLEMLVEDLKQQEKQYYADLLSQNGVEASEENVNIFSNTIDIVEQTKWQPAYALTFSSADESFQVLHEAGQTVQAEFEKANQRYETMMTAPRADLGDNIKKAFQNVDDILADLDLELTSENQRAVRILAYNKTEITVDNINMIKAADAEVQRAFDNMTPAVVLQMIKKGIQPLDLSISQLNDIAAEIKSEIGEESADKFSKFLWKLEKNNQITEEERSSYIGIYRLFAQVEKADRASIGALINQGAPLTMRNLLTAVRSKQKGNMDYEINDDFSGVESKVSGERIDEQIMAAYNLNCIKDISDMLSPERVQSLIDNDWENMTPEQLVDMMKNSLEDSSDDTISDVEYAKEELAMFDEAVSASEDVYRYLDRYDISNNVANVIAASRMMRAPGKMFGILFNEDEMSYDDIDAIRDIKEQILERFSEAIKTPQELADAQQQLAELAAHAMDNMIIEDKNASSGKIREMKLASRQIRIAAQTAKSESFVIPVETGDGITGISLKVVRGKEDKGLVDIFFNAESMGNVAASFQVRADGVSGVIATDNEKTRELINEQINISDIGDDIKVAYVEDISSEHFQASSLRKEEKIMSEQEEVNPIQTRRLYSIAEQFIKSISNLRNSA